MFGGIRAVVSCALSFGRCPYVDQCGPDSGAHWPNDSNDEQAIRRTCLTTRHYACSIYQQRIQQARDLIEQRRRDHEISPEANMDY
jgi:hypothetical protein